MERQELSKEAAIKILNSRSLITSPGKYPVKVTSVNEYINDGESRHIINLAAMNNYHYEIATKELRDGNYNNAVDAHLTTSQRTGKDYIPTVNEMVNIEVDFVKLKSGETALLVNSLTERPISSAGKVQFSFEEEETIVE